MNTWLNRFHMRYYNEQDGRVEYKQSEIRRVYIFATIQGQELAENDTERNRAGTGYNH